MSVVFAGFFWAYNPLSLQFSRENLQESFADRRRSKAELSLLLQEFDLLRHCFCWSWPEHRVHHFAAMLVPKESVEFKTANGPGPGCVDLLERPIGYLPWRVAGEKRFHRRDFLRSRLQ